MLREYSVLGTWDLGSTWYVVLGEYLVLSTDRLNSVSLSWTPTSPLITRGANAQHLQELGKAAPFEQFRKHGCWVVLAWKEEGTHRGENRGGGEW